MNYFETVITDTATLARHNTNADRMNLSPAHVKRIKRENAQRLAWWKAQPAEKRAAFLSHFGT